MPGIRVGIYVPVTHTMRFDKDRFFGDPPRGGWRGFRTPPDLGPPAGLMPSDHPGHVDLRCERARMLSLPRFPALPACAPPKPSEPCHLHCNLPATLVLHASHGIVHQLHAIWHAISSIELLISHLCATRSYERRSFIHGYNPSPAIPRTLTTRWRLRARAVRASRRLGSSASVSRMGSTCGLRLR